jgi:mannose-6-phosphate isomerase
MRVNKPWGFEQIIEKNSSYVVKLLSMNAGHRCSIQYHEKKTETVYVLTGRLKIYIGTSAESLNCKSYLPGEYVTIPCGAIHRMEAEIDSQYLESSTPELDDVDRLQDDYHRD